MLTTKLIQYLVSIMQGLPKNLLIKIGIFLLFIFLVSAIGFLVWKRMNAQTQTPDTSPISQIQIESQDMTTDWAPYANQKYSYQFKCPSDAKHEVNDVSGNGIVMPLYQETCTKGADQVTLQVLSVDARTIDEDTDPSENLTGQEFTLPGGEQKVRIVGHNEEFVNQVISTFETAGS